MKSPRSSQRRKSRRVFSTRLSAYSAAGKAAVAVGAAVGATSVIHGQIVNLTSSSFTGGVTSFSLSSLGNTAAGTASGRRNLQFQLNALHPVTLSFNFTMRNNQWALSRTASGRFSVEGGSGLNFATVPAGSHPNVVKLNFGAHVDGLPFNYGNFEPLLKTHGVAGPTANFPVGQKTNGYFTAGVSGYAGFRVRQYVSSVGYQNYFGWMRIKLTADGHNRPNGFMLVPVAGVYGAYNSQAGGAITAGATAIPEPASVAAGLSLFALGAVGVREHRRRRQAAA